MRTVTAFSLLLICSACLPFSGPIHFHPVGTAPAVAPIPARFKVHGGWQTATIIATLPGGGAYEGSFRVGTPPPGREMAHAWDCVFGPGYFDAKVLGSAQHARVTLVGPEGKHLQAEFHSLVSHPSGLSVSEGVLTDALGRIFKMGQ